MVKLTVMLKMCPFVWDVEVFWILFERINSEQSCKIRYSGKDLLIFLGY